MKHDRKDWALTAAQKMDAREAIDLLAEAGSDLTLTKAVEAALDGRRSLRRITVAEAGELYRRTKAGDWRDGTAGWYESRLNSLADQFPGRQLSSITRPELRAWVAERSRGAQAGYARAARALFRWGLHSEPPLISTDPTDGLIGAAAKAGREEPRFLTVEQSRALISADTPYRHAFLLGLFAGVRPEEIAGTGKPRLPWSSVLIAERIVRVPAECAKTGVARAIEGLPDALWTWLATYPPKGANVSTVAAAKAPAKARELAGMSEWPHDAIRHTFATYAVALLGDAGKVSLWLGHEGNSSIIHRHYRGLATKAQSEAFFALRP